MDAAQAVAAVLARERRDHAPPPRPPSPRRFRGVTVDAAMALGQRHHAMRQRDPAADLRQRRSAAAFCERSSRTSSEEPPPISNSTAPSACGSISVRAAGGGEPRFGLAVDHLELEADVLRDAGAEILAVLGRAAGFGRDQAGAGDALVLHLVAADRERGDRALDRRLADAARGGDALAEPDDAGESIDHAEAVAGRTRHQQAAIIGAEIERGIARPAAIAAQAAVEPSRRPPTPSGPLRRRPINSGVEARGIPGLAAHRH